MDELTLTEIEDARVRIPGRLWQYEHGVIDADELRCLLAKGCLPEYVDATGE